MIVVARKWLNFLDLNKDRYTNKDGVVFFSYIRNISRFLNEYDVLATTASVCNHRCTVLMLPKCSQCVVMEILKKIIEGDTRFFNVISWEYDNSYA